MEIKDLQANQGNVNLELEIIEVEEPRTFEKFGKAGTVCTAKVKDGSGTIKMTLWNEDADKYKAGDKIRLENGWCSEFKGEKQVSAGKFGKITVINEPGEKTELKGEEKTKPKKKNNLPENKKTAAGKKAEKNDAYADVDEEETMVVNEESIE